MKKKNLSQKLTIKKSKIASFDQRNEIKGGTARSNPCDSFESMQCTARCGTNDCPPATNTCITTNCPPNTADCPSGNTNCYCDSFITMAGITGC